MTWLHDPPEVHLYERDNETGFDFAQARYYANAQGRFTSADPFSGSMRLVDPQSFNRYAYVSNNPLNFTDPTGLLAQYDASRNGWSDEDEPGISQSELNHRQRLQDSQQQSPQEQSTSSTSGTVVDNANPSCICNAIPGGTLGPTNNIEANTQTGGNIHDGIHVVGPVGQLSPVTALPRMAGTVIHAGRQTGVERDAGYHYSVVYILLNARLNGQHLVLSLVDMHFETGLNARRQPVIPGHRIGFVDNNGGSGESGLHVTLMSYSTYKKYIGGRWGNAARHSVPVSLLIDAARDPRSPFRCQ